MTKNLDIRPVVYEGYFVSRKGGVYSFKRGSGRLLSIDYDKTGYARVELRTPRGRRRKFFVHRLVAEAFLRPPRGKRRTYVVHKNGDRKDNRLRNLKFAYWRTRD